MNHSFLVLSFFSLSFLFGCSERQAPSQDVREKDVQAWNQCDDAVKKMHLANFVERKDPLSIQAPTPDAPTADAPVVRVGDQVLTEGQLKDMTSRILAPHLSQIPSNQLAQATKSTRTRLAYMFTQRTALVLEAKRRGLAVTSEDHVAFNKELEARAQQNPNLAKSEADLIARHPLGADYAKKEIDESILLRKIEQSFLTEYKAPAQVDEKELNARLRQATREHKLAETRAAEAQEKIMKLSRQLFGLTGNVLQKKFAALARMNSDCPSASKGGDLGGFSKGQMVPEFEKVAFSQRQNTVSAPVKTQFGWHLIMPTKRTLGTIGKDGKLSEPEKVYASHILVKTEPIKPLPSREELAAQMKKEALRSYVQQAIKRVMKATPIESHEFPNFVQ